MTAPLASDAENLDRLLGRFLRRFAFIGPTNIETVAERFAAFIKAAEVPRDPFEILPLLGITIERAILPRGTRAVWKREDGRYVFRVSQHRIHASVRFGLWECMFEVMVSHPRFPSALAPGVKDRLAGRFASLLLMPKTTVLAAAKKFQTNPGALVPILAGKFGVGMTAMRLRLRELRVEGTQQAAR
jgi:hypothetical protein